MAIEYHIPHMAEYRGNPLIEALPAIADDVSILQALGTFPIYDPRERQDPAHHRKHYLERLYRLRQPLSEYISAFHMIERAIMESYLPKYPFSPTTANWLHQLNKVTTEYPRTGKFVSNADGMCIIGISGIGKTSMVERIMARYPSVIKHEFYDGKPFNLVQITHIYAKCPHDSTLGGFCESIITKLQSLLGDELQCGNTIGKMMNQIQGLVRRSFLGLLIIDDLQNLKVNKTGGSGNFINFLLNLIDEAGVPILFIANPEAIEVLQDKFRVARRVERKGIVIMDVVSKEDWDEFFLEALWRYQWTNIETPCTAELSSCLYRLSRGLVSIAIKIYIEAQRLLIGGKNESFSIGVLEQAYHQACKLTDTGLALLTSNSHHPEKIQVQSREYPSVSDNEVEAEIATNRTELSIVSSGSPKNVTISKKCKTKAIIADINGIQHPEFEQKILELAQKEFLFENVKNLNAIRNCQNHQDPISQLKKIHYIAHDPLQLID
ncbi:MAG: ATP-binding protein [Marinagarivorans sp.]